METTEVTVGRIGKAHGIKGEVSVEVRSDEPERRFGVGAAFDAGSGRTLTIASTRWHQGRLLVRFQEATDRTAAEALRGILLTASVPVDEVPVDPDEFYDHQLVGLRVTTVEGDPVGTIGEVLHGAQDLLLINAPDGREILVPFVAALVPTVDVSAGLVTVVDKPGLLRELEAEA